MDAKSHSNGKVAAVVLSTHTVGLGVIRALGMYGVPIHAVYYNKRFDMGYVSKYVTERHLAPHPELNEDEFVDFLVKQASHFGRALLIPADDETLFTVSRNKRLLDKHYIVACPPWDITQKFIDKKFTYRLADSIGVPTPRTLVPQSEDEARSFSKELECPLLVKPCYSHRYFEQFRRKMSKAHNADELMAFYREAADLNLEVMFQELIPGDDTRGVNYNSYIGNGETLAEITAEKVRLSPPGFGVPSAVFSKHVPEIIQPSKRLLAALGFNGVSCTEFKRDPRDGVYKLMEVNGRNNRSLLLSVASGVNFPWIAYQHLVLGNGPKDLQPQYGTYWIDEIRDITTAVSRIGRAPHSQTPFFRPYIKPHTMAVFSLRDPKPFLKRIFDLFRIAISKMN